jgi:hypothetical protein
MGAFRVDYQRLRRKKPSIEFERRNQQKFGNFDLKHLVGVHIVHHVVAAHAAHFRKQVAKRHVLVARSRGHDGLSAYDPLAIYAPHRTVGINDRPVPMGQLDGVRRTILDFDVVPKNEFLPQWVGVLGQVLNAYRYRNSVGGASGHCAQIEKTRKQFCCFLFKGMPQLSVLIFNKMPICPFWAAALSPCVQMHESFFCFKKLKTLIINVLQ